MSIELLIPPILGGTPITTDTLKLRQTMTGSWPNYTLPSTPISGTDEIFLRGQSLFRNDSTDGYTISGVTVTMGSNVPAKASNDELYVNYVEA